MVIKYIEGIVVKGRGVAGGEGYPDEELTDVVFAALQPSRVKTTHTISKQRPYFERTIDGFSEIHNGTINVEISPKFFEILNPDYKVEDCPWVEGYLESFQFVKVELVHNTHSYNGLVYFPMSPELKAHKENNIFELLAPFIEGVNYGDKILIKYNSSKLRVK